jgi:hypothetical protein
VRDKDRDSVETCIGQPYNYLYAAPNCLPHSFRYGVARRGTAPCVPENRKRTFSFRKIRFTFVA